MIEKQEPKEPNATRDNVAEWLRHDLEKIVALCNILRMNVDVFNSLADIIYNRLKETEHKEQMKNQPSLFEEQPEGPIKEQMTSL